MLQGGFLDSTYLNHQLVYKLIKLSTTQDNFKYVEQDVISLLKAGVDLNEITSVFGHRLVHLCAMNGLGNVLIGLVEKCAEHGIELDLGCAHEIEKFTPLHLACARGQLDIVRYILKSSQRIDVNALDYFGMTPADLAYLAGRNKDTLLEELNAYGAFRRVETVLPYQFDMATGLNYFRQTLLHFSNITRHREELKKRVELFTYVDKGDPHLRTPLMYMAMRNSLEGAQFLCGFGANVNAKDYQNRNALFYAVVYANKEMVETMLIAGADPEMTDLHGMSPKSVAELYGRKDILQVFENHAVKRVSEQGRVSFLPAFLRSSIQSIQAIIPTNVLNETKRAPLALTMRKDC